MPDQVKFHSFEGVIHGQVHSKANSRRLVKFGSRIASIKSKEALEFEKSAVQQLKDQFGRHQTIEGVELTIECTIYYPDQRRDLDASLVFDVLQKAGVVKNDRMFREQHLFHAIDKENPRVEFAIYTRGQ